MTMLNQTPVQIAWVTRELEATERMLTGLLGAFDSAVRDAQADGAPVVQQGIMPGGMRFAYVSAAHAGVPYLEIAHIPPDVQAFFDHIKQEQR